MRFQAPGSEQLVSNAKGNYTDEITNTFRDIQFALSKVTQKGVSLVQAQTIYNQVYNELLELNLILQSLGAKSNNGNIILSHVQNILSSYKTALKLDKEGFFNGGNFVSFDETGKAHLNEQIEKMSGDGYHAKYYDIQKVVPRLSNIIARQMGLFAEDIAAAILPGFARVQATQGVSKNLEKTLRGNISGSKSFVKAFIKDIKFEDKDLQKALGGKVEITGHTPITDYNFDLTNGQGTVTFNFSAKEYRSAYINNKSKQQIKGLATTCHRLLLTAALSNGKSGQSQATSYWALLRAAGTTEFMRPKTSRYPDSSPLRKALVEHFISEALFGSGEDAITDLYINGTYYSRGFIANYLTRHNEAILTKVEGFGGRSLSEAEQVFIPPRLALDVLNTSFDFYWEALSRDLPGIFK